MNSRQALTIATLLYLPTLTVAADETTGDTPKALSGMSVLGNNEAPKSLVIVPWKSSEIGNGLDAINALANRPTPVDRDVFKRELRYYELRTASPSEPVTVISSENLVSR